MHAVSMNESINHVLPQSVTLGLEEEYQFCVDCLVYIQGPCVQM